VAVGIVTGCVGPLVPIQATEPDPAGRSSELRDRDRTSIGRVGRCFQQRES